MPGVDMSVARPSDLRGKLSNLLLTDSLSDVLFLVGKNSDRCPCHKLILALGSKVFEAMLYGKMAEKDDVIRVPDVTFAGFNVMLRYLYSEKVHIQSLSEAYETAYVAQKYMIQPLFDACESYLIRNTTLDPDNIFQIHEEATFLDMKLFRGHCLRYISRNTAKVFPSIANASKETLKDIIQLDLMDIGSEVDVIEALWLWGKEQCKQLDMECSVSNVRNLTKDFLKHVRFLSLKKKDLEAALGRFHLLDEEEMLAVLWNTAMPSGDGIVIKMPMGLCDVAKTRSVSNCSRLELPTEYRYDGSLTEFSIHKHCTTVQVTVTGPQVTIVGAVLSFKPIPCYSPVHRSLNFELKVGNNSTRLESRARLLEENEEVFERLEQELLLEDFVVVSEGETVKLSVKMAGEGVRLMQCVKKEFSCRCGDALVTFRFDAMERTLFPIKELMCVV